MLRVIIKALIVIWPFLKNVIFKDRTVKEVLRANMQFTWVTSFLIIVSVTLIITVGVLSNTKLLLAKALNDITKLKQEVIELQTAQCVPSDSIPLDETSTECTVVVYDKSRLLELLN